MLNYLKDTNVIEKFYHIGTVEHNRRRKNDKNLMCPSVPIVVQNI